MCTTAAEPAVRWNTLHLPEEHKGSGWMETEISYLRAYSLLPATPSVDVGRVDVGEAKY